jgi:hypothetical protein
MRLALFDLDHTLLPIDSADAWSHFLVRAGGLDPSPHDAQIRRFADDYRSGSFDPEEYLAFQMGLLARFPRATLEQIRADFVREVVEPNLRDEAFELIESHRCRGHELALATGTNAFVTAPIGERLGLQHLLAVCPEQSTAASPAAMWAITPTVTARSWPSSISCGGAAARSKRSTNARFTATRSTTCRCWSGSPQPAARRSSPTPISACRTSPGSVDGDHCSFSPSRRASAKRSPQA